MRFVYLFVISLVCNSCFLFSNLKQTKFEFDENGSKRLIHTVVPRKYIKSENVFDSSGNQVQYYYYAGGTVLYFAFLKDTSAQLQPINYDLNIPKQLYQTIYFKGLDSTSHYWRETRFDHYRAGYKNVNEDDDGKFDSSINYFTLRLKR